MKKKYEYLLIYFITIFFLYEFFINTNEMINIIFKTIKLCYTSLLPSIIVFFTITDILNNYNFSFYLSKAFGKIMNKIFHLPECAIYIFIMSISAGFPGNSKLIKEQLDNGNINEFEATKILTMTHFSNPLFIIYTVGIQYFHDKKIGFIILFSHYITNIIIGLLFRNTYNNIYSNHKLKYREPENFINMLKTSINNTIKLLVNIFGIIIFFAIITFVLNKYLQFKTFSNVIFNGLIEITNGLNILSQLNISKIKAATLATFFISFGGFSVHMQVMSILNNYSINYYIYTLARIMHATISAIITFLIIST